MGRAHLVAIALVGAFGGALGAVPAFAGEGARGGEGPGARSGPDAAALVASMSRAMRTLDYEGTFVHAARGHLSSMHILHSSDERGELERLRALDGEAREVVRDHASVTCVWPASSSVVVTRSKPRRGLPDVDASLATNPSYAIETAGLDRVAGLDVHVVQIRPVDALRYGYRFWIDADTHMLLRSMLVDETGRVLEEVLFTSIEYGPDVDPSRFAVGPLPGRRARVESSDTPSSPLPDAPGRDVVTGGDAHGAGGGDDGGEPSDRVDFEALPPGYAELGETHRAMPVEGGPVSHVMLSDGVASVSVYVEHLPRSEQDTSATGPSSIGGIHAYGSSLEAGFVTVVGEVPAATVRGIADAVRLAD